MWGKKLRARRHKMQDEVKSSSNGRVQAAYGREVNAGKVPAVAQVYLTHKHTHTHAHTHNAQSEVNCRPTHTRPLVVTSAVHLLFYCRSRRAADVSVAVSLSVCVCVGLGAAPGSRATCLLPLAEPLLRLRLRLRLRLCLPATAPVKVLRFMSKWFVRLPRHLISFLSLFQRAAQHTLSERRTSYAAELDKAMSV